MPADALPTPPLASAGTAGTIDSGALQLRLLGAAELHRPSGTFVRWPSRAATLLLARLALAPDRAHAREELVELLWPGVAPGVGRNRLRQVLSTLKATLEPGPLAVPVIRAERSTLRLHPGRVVCDAVDFEAAARRGDLAACAALYRGPLMPGFYDEWVLDDRQRLEMLHERAAAAAAQAAEAAASMPSSVPWVPSPPVDDDHLPAYWTRVFGVEQPAARLRALVCSHRLVSVHGPGGSGKTRLAVEVAQSLRPAGGDRAGAERGASPFERVVFVPLIDCVQRAQVQAALAGALGAEGGAPEAQRIATALSGRRVLLVLDNLEQLEADAESEIERLLSSAARVHVLATSRRLLGVSGEVAFEVEGLPLPQSTSGLAAAQASAAVALLIDRARAACGEFDVGPQNLAATVELVRLLGGVPLALELAASRLRSYSPQELVGRLREHGGTPMLDLLTRGSQRASAHARHASLRNVMEWSWQQLSADAAELLSLLSVLAAPAGVGALGALADRDEASLQALLDVLRDASLVRSFPGDDGETRYELMQPVREYAAERLHPTAARAARGRMRRWLQHHGREVLKSGPGALQPELPHVHAAITSAVGDDEPLQAIALALALRVYWDADAVPLPTLVALESAAQRLADQRAADAEDGVDAEDTLCDLHELLSLGRVAAGHAAEAMAHADRALAHARGPDRRSRALVRWATTAYQTGHLDADFDTALDEALRLAHDSRDLAGQASVLRVQAVLRSNLHLDFAGAEALAEQSQQLWEQVGNASMVRLCLLSRAVLWGWQGRTQDGLAVHEACEAEARSSGDWLGLIHVTRQLGRLYIRARRWPDAAAALRRSLQVAWRRKHAQGVAHALLHLGDALVLSREPAETEAAARLHGFAAQHWTRTYGTLNPIEARELRRTWRLLRRRLGVPRAEALRVQGVMLSLEEAVEVGLQQHF